MVPTLCLFTCVLATAQPADRSEWLVVPRLNRAQELVYRGAFVEEAFGDTVRFSRSYRLETRVFVAQTLPQGSDIAVLTILKLRPGRSERGEEPTTGRDSHVLLDHDITGIEHAAAGHDQRGVGARSDRAALAGGRPTGCHGHRGVKDHRSRSQRGQPDHARQSLQRFHSTSLCDRRRW